MTRAYREPRVDPAELRALPLRAHELLGDVPLHDVWRFRLHGSGPSVAVGDLIDLFVQMGTSEVSRTERFLFALRSSLHSF